MRTLLLASWAIVMVLISADPVLAGHTLMTGPGDLPGDELLIDFSTAPIPFNEVTDIDGVTFEAVGTGFGLTSHDELSLRENGPQEPRHVDNFDGALPPPQAPVFPDLRMTFPSPINLLAWESRQNDADEIDITLICMSEGVVTETFTVTTGDALIFHFRGFTTTSSFDEVIFDVQQNANGAIALDNLRYKFAAEVPGVSATASAVLLLLLATALGSLVLLIKKQGDTGVRS